MPSACAAYERLRRPRVEQVAARARKTNNTKSFGPIATTVMGVLTPLAMKTFLTPERTVGPEHRHRIAWDDAAIE